MTNFDKKLTQVYTLPLNFDNFPAVLQNRTKKEKHNGVHNPDNFATDVLFFVLLLSLLEK